MFTQYLVSVTIIVVGEARLISIIWKYLVSFGWEIIVISTFNMQSYLSPVKRKKDEITIATVSLQLSNDEVILKLEKAYLWNKVEMLR